MLGTDNVSYTVVAQQDGSYAVKVIRPNDLPQLVEGFATAADAQSWIEDNQIEGAVSGPSSGDPFHTFRNR
jgi:hypothetical protein